MRLSFETQFKTEFFSLPPFTGGKKCFEFPLLDVKIDTNLTWQYHINDFFIELNRADAVLFKMRKWVSLKILRSIYFAVFDL